MDESDTVLRSPPHSPPKGEVLHERRGPVNYRQVQSDLGGQLTAVDGPDGVERRLLDEDDDADTAYVVIDPNEGPYAHAVTFTVAGNVVAVRDPRITIDGHAYQMRYAEWQDRADELGLYPEPHRHTVYALCRKRESDDTFSALAPLTDDGRRPQHAIAGTGSGDDSGSEAGRSIPERDDHDTEPDGAQSRPANVVTGVGRAGDTKGASLETTDIPPLFMHREGFDPAPQLLGLRNGPPVIRFHGERIPAWLVTGYEQTRQVLRDERFSFLAPPEVTLPRPPGRHLDSDDPAHARLRQMLAGEFTAKRMRQLRPWIEKTVTQQLNDMERAGPPADLVSSFAQPVVSLVTCKLLGIPYPDFAGFERQRVLLSDEFANYLADLVARRRAEPGDGILGTLLRKYGSELTDQDTVNLLRLLVRVGRQPVIDVLTLGTALLLCNPRQLALLRDQPAVVDTAVEEITRYLTIGHRAPRTARTDVALGGEQIKAGDWVLCALVVANRSSALGADVDTLDLTRKPNRHLAFGHGIHHCIGAPLARMQMSIAYPALLRRFPSLRLAVPVEELPFPEFSYLYNLSSLPVTWDQNDKPAVPHVDVENSPLQTVTYVSNLNR